jgi:hypothetical protein
MSYLVTQGWLVEKSKTEELQVWQTRRSIPLGVIDVGVQDGLGNEIY